MTIDTFLLLTKQPPPLQLQRRLVLHNPEDHHMPENAYTACVKRKRHTFFLLALPLHAIVLMKNARPQHHSDALWKINTLTTETHEPKARIQSTTLAVSLYS